MLPIYANIRTTAPGNVRREYKGLILYFRTSLMAVPIVIIIQQKIFSMVTSELARLFAFVALFPPSAPTDCPIVIVVVWNMVCGIIRNGNIVSKNKVIRLANTLILFIPRNVRRIPCQSDTRSLDQRAE
jgi:hypothetical protein